MTRSKRETTQSVDPKPRWGLILSATFLALIVIIAVVMMVTKSSGDADADQAQAPRVESSDDSVLRDDRQAETDRLGRVVFHPKNSAGDVLDRLDTAPAEGDPNWTTARPDVEWQRLSGQTEITIARDYPFSAMAGPWEVTDGLAHGFAHTPQGAALAGIHAFLAMGQGGDEATRAAYHFFIDEEVRKGLRELMGNSSVETPEAPWTSTFAAYAVLHYDDDNALVRYAFPSGESYLQMDMKLIWAEGDWRVANEGAVGETAPVAESEVESWVQL